MQERLEGYHTRLNRKDIVSGLYYRRNHVLYPLICYINNIIGLYLSSNLDGIPFFIKRAYEHAMRYRSEYEDEPYYQLVLEYLALMAEFILALGVGGEVAKNLIPEQLLPNEG